MPVALWAFCCGWARPEATPTPAAAQRPQHLCSLLHPRLSSSEMPSFASLLLGSCFPPSEHCHTVLAACSFRWNAIWDHRKDLVMSWGRSFDLSASVSCLENEEVGWELKVPLLLCIGVQSRAPRGAAGNSSQNPHTPPHAFLLGARETLSFRPIWRMELGQWKKQNCIYLVIWLILSRGYFSH